MVVPARRFACILFWSCFPFGGAAVCSALLNVNLDAERKLTQEFRTLGANVVIAPPASGSEAALADAAVLERIAALRFPQIVATAPYLYVAANSGSQPVILAGTWFDEVAKMNSWWKLQGSWLSSRDDHVHCLVGFTAARIAERIEAAIGDRRSATVQA